MSTVIQLKLRRPHVGQQRIYAEKRRFNVVCCGRRYGKTILGTNLLIEAALEGAPVAWISPTYKMLLEVWRDFLHLSRPIIARNGIDKQNKRVTLINGVVVEFWSLVSAESIRGRKYKRVIIDEAAMDPLLLDHWNLVIRATLADYKGDAFFLSTPKGRNGFWELFQLGLPGGDEDWMSFQQPTTTNPHIDAGEIESMRRTVPELVFIQEFLAQFVDSNSGVLRRVMEAAVAELQDRPRPGAQYAIGVDWARSGDFTVFTVIDVGRRAVVAIDRFTEVGYETQVSRLVALCHRWRPQTVIAEANSMGGPLIESLQTNHNLPIIPFWTSNASKCQIVDALALAFERGEITIPNDPLLIGELLSFEASRLPSGLVRYAAAGNGHDDMVISLCLAYHAADRTPATGQQVGVWRRS